MQTCIRKITLLYTYSCTNYLFQNFRKRVHFVCASINSLSLESAKTMIFIDNSTLNFSYPGTKGGELGRKVFSIISRIKSLWDTILRFVHLCRNVTKLYNPKSLLSLQEIPCYDFSTSSQSLLSDELLIHRRQHHYQSSGLLELQTYCSNNISH